MKTRSTFALCCLFAGLLSLGCTEKKHAADDHPADNNEWKEMDDFHMVMAEAFHPYKDSADLSPAKANINDLVASAEKWADARLPEKVDNEEMKSRLRELKSETEVLREKIQSASEQEIGEQLTKVHDIFHAVQEAWYGNGDSEHGHEHAH